MEQTDFSKIMSELEFLKKSVVAIQERLDESCGFEILEESDLSLDDKNALEDSRVEEREGKLTSVEDLKAEFGL